MNTLNSTPAYSTAFMNALSEETLRQRVPAIYAPSAHESRSSKFTFISTSTVVDALASAGFYPVEARQAVRARSVLHARHLIRFRRKIETVSLREAVPEILFVNAHDGTSAYRLMVGLYRTVCTNGLVVSQGIFPTFRVHHRGDVVADVVKAALEVSERFELLATAVDRMERTRMDQLERLDFAAQAFALRFRGSTGSGLEPGRLLVPRRAEDAGNDVWRTFNVVQENILRGGILHRTQSGQLRRTRGVSAIREDVRLNTGLWDLALARAA